jgi:hypothetical protein
MKSYVCGFALACILVFTFTGCATTGAHLTAWEYKSINMTNAYPWKEVEALGEQGWELVAVTDGGFYFKRPIQK